MIDKDLIEKYKKSRETEKKKDVQVLSKEIKDRIEKIHEMIKRLEICIRNHQQIKSITCVDENSELIYKCKSETDDLPKKLPCFQRIGVKMQGELTDISLPDHNEPFWHYEPEVLYKEIINYIELTEKRFKFDDIVGPPDVPNCFAKNFWGKMKRIENADILWIEYNAEHNIFIQKVNKRCIKFLKDLKQLKYLMYIYINQFNTNKIEISNLQEKYSKLINFCNKLIQETDVGFYLKRYDDKKDLVFRELISVDLFKILKPLTWIEVEKQQIFTYSKRVIFLDANICSGRCSQNNIRDIVQIPDETPSNIVEQIAQQTRAELWQKIELLQSSLDQLLISQAQKLSK